MRLPFFAGLMSTLFLPVILVFGQLAYANGADCEGRLKAAAAKRRLERGAVLWTIIRDQQPDQSAWEHLLMGSETEPQFAIPSDNVFIVKPEGQKSDGISKFTEAITKALKKIQSQPHPQLFININAHGTQREYATDFDAGWSIDHSSIRKIISEEINKWPGLKDKLQLNLCIDACHGFAGFREFSKIEVPVHIVAASNAYTVARGNTLIRVITPINRIAAEVLGHAPNVFELGRFQGLLEAGSNFFNANLVAGSTQSGLTTWTPSELAATMHFITDPLQASTVGLRFYRMFHDECVTWARSALKSSKSMERKIAQRILKYSEFDYDSVKNWALPPELLVEVGLNLGVQYDEAIEIKDHVSGMMPPNLLPELADFLDVLLLARFGRGLGRPDELYAIYGSALSEHGNSLRRMDVMLDSLRNLARSNPRVVKHFGPDFEIKTFYDGVFEKQFRSQAFLALDPVTQHLVEKEARARDCAFENILKEKDERQ